MTLETLSRDELILLARAKRALLLREDAERLEASLIEFYKAAWPVFDPAPYVHGWHLEAIAEHLEAVSNGQIKKLLINMPPRHGKTLLTSVVWPAWTWAKQRVDGNPLIGAQTKFLCLSYGDALSLDSAILMRRLVQSPWYQERWGSRVRLTADQEAKSKFDNTAGGTRISASFDGTVTGRGGDIKCFPPNERVRTENGLVAICDLVDAKKQIKVWSFNPHTGAIDLKPVTGWHRNAGRSIVEVALNDGSTVQCTPDHKIWTQRGWVEAVSLTASDTLPRFALENLADCSSVNIEFSRQRTLAKRRRDNLKHVLVGKLGLMMSCAFSSIAGAPRFAYNFHPRSAISNGLDALFGDAVNGGDINRRSGASSNFNGVRLGQFGSGSLFVTRESPVLLGIVDVLRSSTVAKVIKTAIAPVAVVVANFLSVRAWADKRNHHNLVVERKERLSIAAQAHSRVSLVKGWLKNFVFAANGPVLGDAVAGEVRDRKPLSIKFVGHVESTYCLTVADYNTFLVGSGDIIVSNCIDDPHKADEAESEVKREGVIRKYDGVLKSRMTDPKHTAEVVIMQRLNHQDLSEHLLDDGEHVHLWLPAEFESDRRCTTVLGWTDPRQEDGELLWPERFGKKELAPFKRNPYEWAGQWQQRPEIRGGAIIKREYWQDYVTDDGKVPQCQYVVASLDPAYTAKSENDPSGFTVWGVWYDEKGHSRIICLNAWRKRLELHGPHIDREPGEAEAKYIRRAQPSWGLCEWVAYSCKRFRVHKLLIESKASGLSVAQEIRRLHSGQGWSVQLVDPKGLDKVTRCHAVVPMFADQQIFLPTYSDGQYREWGQQLVDEFASFPKGATDDLVDSSTQALTHIRELGLAVRRDERAAIDRELGRHKSGKHQALYPS